MWPFDAVIAARRRRRWARLTEDQREVARIFNSLSAEDRAELFRELDDHKRSYAAWRRQVAKERDRDNKARRLQRAEKERKLDAWRKNYTLLAEVEEVIAAPEIEEPWDAWMWRVLRWRRWRPRRGMAWLSKSLAQLTSDPPGEGFMDCRSAAWIATADLHRRQGNTQGEIDCLRYALELNPKAPVKRRLKAAEKAAGHP
jgi:hypothetical protein